MTLPEYHHHEHRDPFPQVSQLPDSGNLYGGCACRPQPPALYPVPYPPPRPDRSAQVVKWAAAGAVGSFALLAFAVAAVAFAVGAVSVTICAVVLRGLWNDMRKDR